MKLRLPSAILITFLACSQAVLAETEIKGKIIDAETGEELIGAAVLVKEMPGTGAVSGLDGSFVFDSPLDVCTLVCSSIGYKNQEICLSSGGNGNLLIVLEPDNVALEAVVVTADNAGRTETAARGIEKASLNVVNVMSARAIQLSPDMTVANAVKRMSGVTMERNSSGEGQYAILRGMDKRYNYTLVNGVKIPSPDNKNRFVPLDIFPSDMLDRIEVAKSLTADMEGDGIGGSINLVMKDAPSSLEMTAELSSGYNSLFLNHDFQSFSHHNTARLSPYEAKGKPEDYAVTMDDFTMSNLRMKWGSPLPDLSGSFSIGNRFLEGRLGLIVAISFQNDNRGKSSDLYFQPGTTHNGTEHRFYSTGHQRLGTHAKLDWKINPDHKLIFYTGYMNLQESEVRDAADEKEGTVKMKWNTQSIFNTTIKGEHGFLDSKALKLKWSGTWSKAWNSSPDNVKIYLNGNHLANTDAVEKRWEHNSDRDIAGYLDLSYDLWFAGASHLRLSAGGMYRDKVRDSFFNEFIFDSATGLSDLQYRGEDWNNFDELLLVPHRYGNIGDPLNYDALERIGAGYAMAVYTSGRLEVIAGLRAEHTEQGYVLEFPRSEDPEGFQTYTDLLPSVHLKYGVHRNAWMKFSYFRGINRPGFFEIVPYTILNEDYTETGNPDLRHTVADNLDLRYEFFPGASEQFMAGVFYKRIKDPIEYGIVQIGQATCFRPMNFGEADNFGLELDVLKYFRWFGIKANYTWTHSSMTTEKKMMVGNEISMTSQTRPLAGQAAHVANLSLLFNSSRTGIEAQISGNYTGKRLSEISEWYMNDIWEAGYIQLDASVEKSFKSGWSVFIKGTNLTDAPVIRYISAGPQTESLKDYERYLGNVIERREWHGISVVAGVRFSLDKSQSK